MQELDHIQFLKHVLSKTYDESTASEITACLRPSTIKQYEIHWKSFQRFLHNKHIRIIDKNSVMKYLIFLFKIKKLSPKTILVHRNAISEPVRLAFNISTEDRVQNALQKLLSKATSSSTFYAKLVITTCYLLLKNEEI